MSDLPLYYLERGADCEATRDEVAADRIYSLCGIAVPHSPILTDEAGLVWRASLAIAGTRLDAWTRAATAAQMEAVALQIGGGLAVDVLLGNTDVIGGSQQNIVVDAGGKAWRVDQGSAFQWMALRASHSPQQAVTLQVAHDINWLRHGAATQCLYGHLRDAAISGQVAALPMEAILAATPPRHRDAIRARHAVLLCFLSP